VSLILTNFAICLLKFPLPVVLNYSIEYSTSKLLDSGSSSSKLFVGEHWRAASGVARIWRGEHNTTWKLFVSYIMRSTGTVHTSAKACITSVAIRIRIRIRIHESYPDPWSGSPPKCNHLFISPLPTFPGNFMQIRTEVLLCKVANKQTDKQRRKHNLLGGGNDMK